MRIDELTMPYNIYMRALKIGKRIDARVTFMVDKKPSIRFTYTSPNKAVYYNRMFYFNFQDDMKVPVNFVKEIEAFVDYREPYHLEDHDNNIIDDEYVGNR